MTTGSPSPLLDWSSHPAILGAQRKDRARTMAYVGLAFGAAALITIVSLSDGISPVDALYFAVVALVSFFGAAMLYSMIGSGKVHGGLKVYPQGLALPWRSGKAADRNEENFLTFQSIAEIRVLPRSSGGGIVIVPRGEGKPRNVWIEPEWIPEKEVLLMHLRGKVPLREFRDGQ